jgi:hypothetical protein
MCVNVYVMYVCECICMHAYYLCELQCVPIMCICTHMLSALPPDCCKGPRASTYCPRASTYALYVSDDTHTYASRTQTRMQLHACTFTFTLNPRPSTQTLF